jgi:hypothetical protein
MKTGPLLALAVLIAGCSTTPSTPKSGIGSTDAEGFIRISDGT